MSDLKCLLNQAEFTVEIENCAKGDIGRGRGMGSYFLKLPLMLMDFFVHIVVIWLSSGLNNTKPTRPWHKAKVCKYDYNFLKESTKMKVLLPSESANLWS